MEMKELLKRLIDNEPWGHCAEEGTYCVYCGEGRTLTFHTDKCDHRKDCLWLQIVSEAKKLDKTP